LASSIHTCPSNTPSPTVHANDEVLAEVRLAGRAPVELEVILDGDVDVEGALVVEQQPGGRDVLLTPRRVRGAVVEAGVPVRGEVHLGGVGPVGLVGVAVERDGAGDEGDLLDDPDAVLCLCREREHEEGEDRKGVAVRSHGEYLCWLVGNGTARRA
jgi:hypothetical protein